MNAFLRKMTARVGAAVLFGTSFTAVALEPDQLTAPTLSTAHPVHARAPIKSAGASALAAGLNRSTSGGGVPGIDSLVNFTGSYHAKGVDPLGNRVSTWTYAMVGTPPERGGTTTLRAPVIPVSVDLRDSSGKPRSISGHRLYSDGTQYVRPVLQSPLFQNFWYSSSDQPTQYDDSIQRAEFWTLMEDDWHTLMRPDVGRAQVIKVSQDAACGTTLTDGSAGHCNYQFKLNADGTCCRYILIDVDYFVSLLFPSTVPVNSSTPIGAAELNGDMTTKDISTLLFPNTFLYFGDPSQCCVVGFHSFDYEAGDSRNGNLPRFYVMNYSAWTSPGIFSGGAFADVTALSHELAETFNDPFVVFDGVTNLTPWWLSPNGNCQDDLEVGDVVEGLTNQSFPITMRGYTYHPQNVALLQWFEFKNPSNAIGGAYSYPDPSVITQLSAPQKANCAP